MSEQRDFAADLRLCEAKTLADMQLADRYAFMVAAITGWPAALREIERLQGEVERLGAVVANGLRSYGPCDVCWTSSWAPCPEREEGAIADPNSIGNFMVCQHCQVVQWLTEKNARIADLEAALRPFAQIPTVSKFCAVTVMASQQDIINARKALEGKP